MKSLLILRNLKVENANAIAGLTWGFPAISNFLGFTHALSRTTEREYGLRLGGCAVVCHRHDVCAHQPGGWGDYNFSLTRNPLNKDASTASFVEEGRMHMEVSLVIECDFTASALAFGGEDRDDDILQFQKYVHNKVLAQRLAGGTILNLNRWEPVLFAEVPEENERIAKFRKKLLHRLLPGFLLVSRTDLLAAHFAQMRERNTQAELIDAWLDFAALKFRAEYDPKHDDLPLEQRKVKWQRVARPANGWLVPLSTGYKAISSLFENGDVTNTRDNQTPFRYVESAYTIGQWISPHRIYDLDHLFWRYHFEGDWYLCKNYYQPGGSSALSDTTNN